MNENQVRSLSRSFVERIMPHFLTKSSHLFFSSLFDLHQLSPCFPVKHAIQDFLENPQPEKVEVSFVIN